MTLYIYFNEFETLLCPGSPGHELYWTDNWVGKEGETKEGDGLGIVAMVACVSKRKEFVGPRFR